jgi:hypothetical protein
MNASTLAFLIADAALLLLVLTLLVVTEVGAERSRRAGQSPMP